MGILIDTSIIVDFLRQKDKRGSWFYKLSHDNDSLAISILTHAELYSGKSVYESQKNKRYLDSIISRLNIVVLDLPISTLGARLRAKSGVDLLDCLIGATAIRGGYQLATLNSKHFKEMKNLKLLKPPR
jgi:predicted nucleic acid-binding protein